MFFRATALCVLALLVGYVPTARAQESGEFGITMGYPQSIGLVAHVSDRLAIRPEFLFRHSSSDDSVVEQSATTIGTGVSVLWYLSKVDGLRTYVSPRYEYLRTSATIGTIVLPPTPTLPPRAPTTVTTTSTTSSHAIGASFGAQYALHKRFSIFGEVGVNYTRAEVTTEFFVPDRSSHPWSIASQTAVGVILYFKD